LDRMVVGHIESRCSLFICTALTTSLISHWWNQSSSSSIEVHGGVPLMIVHSSSHVCSSCQNLWYALILWMCTELNKWLLTLRKVVKSLSSGNSLYLPFLHYQCELNKWLLTLRKDMRSLLSGNNLYFTFSSLSMWVLYWDSDGVCRGNVVSCLGFLCSFIHCWCGSARLETCRGSWPVKFAKKRDLWVLQQLSVLQQLPIVV
jgi:hypothetical protein